MGITALLSMKRRARGSLWGTKWLLHHMRSQLRLYLEWQRLWTGPWPSSPHTRLIVWQAEEQRGDCLPARAQYHKVLI